jgi:hypothetical protein
MTKETITLLTSILASLILMTITSCDTIPAAINETSIIYKILTLPIIGKSTINSTFTSILASCIFYIIFILIPDYSKTYNQTDKLYTSTLNTLSYLIQNDINHNSNLKEYYNKALEIKELSTLSLTLSNKELHIKLNSFIKSNPPIRIYKSKLDMLYMQTKIIDNLSNAQNIFTSSQQIRINGIQASFEIIYNEYLKMEKAQSRTERTSINNKEIETQIMTIIAILLKAIYIK